MYRLQMAAEALALHQNGFDVREQPLPRPPRAHVPSARRDFEDFTSVSGRSAPRTSLTGPAGGAVMELDDV